MQLKLKLEEVKKQSERFRALLTASLLTCACVCVCVCVCVCAWGRMPVSVEYTTRMCTLYKLLRMRMRASTCTYHTMRFFFLQSYHIRTKENIGTILNFMNFLEAASMPTAQCVSTRTCAMHVLFVVFTTIFMRSLAASAWCINKYHHHACMAQLLVRHVNSIYAHECLSAIIRACV